MKIEIEEVSSFDRTHNNQKDFRITFIDDNDCATFVLNAQGNRNVCSITLNKKHYSELKSQLRNFDTYL